MKNLLFLTAISFFAVGCTTRIADFTLLSSKNVDLSKGASLVRGTQRVTGEDLKTTVLIFPTGIPNVKEAVDNAIEKTPGGVALVDGTVKQKYVWFLLGGESGFIVEGTPLIDQSLIQK